MQAQLEEPELGTSEPRLAEKEHCPPGWHGPLPLGEWIWVLSSCGGGKTRSRVWGPLYTPKLGKPSVLRSQAELANEGVSIGRKSPSPGPRAPSWDT